MASKLYVALKSCITLVAQFTVFTPCTIPHVASKLYNACNSRITLVAVFTVLAHCPPKDIGSWHLAGMAGHLEDKFLDGML